MDLIEQDVRVAFRYPVHFTAGVFSPANIVLRDAVRRGGADPAEAIVVVDGGLHAARPGIVDEIEAYFHAHADALHLAGPVVVMSGGEPVKNDPRHLTILHEAIHDARLCRHSYVIAVGGGAMLDVVGYAAAVAHRGIRLVRIPTTVLSQDDSAMGVKNGVNGFGTKNYFGVFAPPFAVINDGQFLETLADRDWLGGVSEAVKVALIKDAAFFGEIEAGVERLVARDRSVMDRVVQRSAILHLEHIATSGDPFELGSSRPLDFGHWAAHRIEHLTDHRVGHGEAVAIGIALDSTYARLMGMLSDTAWRRILDVIVGLRLAVHVPEMDAHLRDPGHERALLRGLAQFREHLGGRLTIMLLREVGQAFDVHEIDDEVMIRSVEMLREIEAHRSSVSTAERVLTSASPRGRS